MAATLIAESVGKTYGTHRVLISARLEARAGEVTFVAGRNGAGKSTLLRIAAGATSTESGFVKFRNAIFERPRLHQLAQSGLFYLPDRDILSPVVPLRRQLMTVSARFRSAKIETAAEACGVSHLLDAAPKSYSTGERRRAELCVALVRRPVCLIADEPLRGIDPKDAELLVGRFRSLADEGCAVIVSGHDVATLLDAADSVVWVTSGTTHELGNPAKARRNEAFRREYLSGSWQAPATPHKGAVRSRGV